MDNSEKLVCPVCGYDSLERIQQKHVLSEPFGGSKEISVDVFFCSACGSSGDFNNEHEKLFDQAQEILKQQSVQNILKDLAKVDINMAAIERVLDLPQRTLTKWKNGISKPSASAAALLKFIKLFPWLLEVADNKYDYDTAQKIHTTSAIQSLLTKIKFDESTFSSAGAGVVSTTKSDLYYFHVEKENVPNAYDDTSPQVFVNTKGNPSGLFSSSPFNTVAESQKDYITGSSI